MNIGILNIDQRGTYAFPAHRTEQDLSRMVNLVNERYVSLRTNQQRVALTLIVGSVSAVALGVLGFPIACGVVIGLALVSREFF
jgi:hypothetical protein